MPMITLSPSGKTWEAPVGATLLAALADAGDPIGGKCEGNGKCGACHVFILEGRKGISKTTRQENETLDALVGVSSKSRLACQVTLGEEPITIEIPQL